MRSSARVATREAGSVAEGGHAGAGAVSRARGNTTLAAGVSPARRSSAAPKHQSTTSAWPWPAGRPGPCPPSHVTLIASHRASVQLFLGARRLSTARGRPGRVPSRVGHGARGRAALIPPAVQRARAAGPPPADRRRPGAYIKGPSTSAFFSGTASATATSVAHHVSCRDEHLDRCLPCRGGAGRRGAQQDQPGQVQPVLEGLRRGQDRRPGGTQGPVHRCR